KSGEISALPPGWLVRWQSLGVPVPEAAALKPSPLSLVPGVVDHKLAQLFNDAQALFPLPAKHGLVPLEWRQAPSKVSPLPFDNLATLAGSIGWLRAYAQLYGNNLYVEQEFLCEQARLRLAEGGGDIAIRLADRAAECARSPELVSMCHSYAQGIRVATRRFA